MSSKSHQDRSGRRGQLSLSGNTSKYQQSHKVDAGLNGQDTNGTSKREKAKGTNNDLEKNTTNKDVQNKLQINQSPEIKQVHLHEKVNEENKLTESNGKEQTDAEKHQSNVNPDLAAEVINIDDNNDLAIENQSIETKKETSITQLSSQSSEKPGAPDASGLNDNQQCEDNIAKQSDLVKSQNAANTSDDDIAKVIAIAESTSTINIDPAATSTPGKFLSFKTKVDTPKLPFESDFNLYPRSFNQISGRRSIRSLKNYTPGCNQGKSQFTESYRPINTELDVSSITDISTNATMGSEVHNNSSFSFFGFGRKRERAFSNSQLNQDVQLEGEITPRKRARMDKNIIFSVLTSPFRQLTSQFSKANIKNENTPKKQETLTCVEDTDDVQNVSGTSITDSCSKNKNEEVFQQEEQDVHSDVSKNNEKDNSQSGNITDISMEKEKPNENGLTAIQYGDTPIPSNEKAKRCAVM